MSGHRVSWRVALFAFATFLVAVAPAGERAIAGALHADALRTDGANGILASDDVSSADAAHAALSPAEWTAIRSAIGDQLTALRSGDASRAFSFASTGIREQFHDAPTFLRMVQDSYAVLLNARYTEFLEGAVIDGHTIQPLRLIMNDDTVLVALYEMQRDERGGWRIAGCVIASSTVRST
jgi:hypothetical protein